jgi:hypothetical protein
MTTNQSGSNKPFGGPLFVIGVYATRQEAAVNGGGAGSPRQRAWPQL